MPSLPFCGPESYFALARRRLPSPRPPALTANGFTCHVALVTGSVMDGGSGWGPAQLKVRSGDRGALPPPHSHLSGGAPCSRQPLLRPGFSSCAGAPPAAISAPLFVFAPRISLPQATVNCVLLSSQQKEYIYFFFLITPPASVDLIHTRRASCHTSLEFY